MPFNPDAPELLVGIVGAGAMGRGIAQIVAQAGCRVLLFDSRPDAVDAACTAIAETLHKQVAKGKLTAADASAACGRIAPAASLGALADCLLVVEAIVENLEAKRSLLGELESILTSDAVMASNTSSLSITALAAATRHPGRVAGWHFFNPVPLMRVVEIVDGVRTDPLVGDALMGLTRRVGHTPIRAKDTPGFVVNHAGRGYGTEALRIIGEGICEPIDVDRVMREAAGFRLGPFELLDLTALDVSHPVMESIYHQFYEEPRFRPSVITAQRLAGGLLGRKSGRGFYDYGSGASPPGEAPAPLALPGSVWVSSRRAVAREAVLKLVPSKVDIVAAPHNAEVCVVLPLGMDTTSAALEESLDATRTVALETFTPMVHRRTLMLTPVTRIDVRHAAHALFAADGVAVSVIRDSSGFIAQRILAMIVNIACDIAQQRIASPADIDLAVRLGLNYPAGPLSMGDALGPSRLLEILNALVGASGDPRYRPSPWLSRRARLGVSLLTEDL